jgi:phosphate transport system protein
MPPTEHLSRAYEQDLEAIRSRVLQMGGLVEKQYYDAMTAFRLLDEKEAQRIKANDVEVNQMEVALDDACSHLIVKRQPAANDLRTVMATIKVITDLERIGDEATKIARAAQAINQRGIAHIAHEDIVRSMASSAGRLLHDSLDAFARLDEKQATRLILEDEKIDNEFRSVMRNLITFMMEDPRTISSALDTLWVAKAIERVGDHAKNIAEYVVYIVEGKDIRHTDYASQQSAA